MIRWIVLAAIACLVCRWVFGRWPWEYLRTQGAGQQRLAAARRRLDVPGNATREQIVEAHRRLVRRVHPDMGGSSEEVHEADAARDILLDRLAKEKRPR